MLVLSRKVNERIVVGDSLVITVTAIRGDRVRLGFEGPPGVKIHREEVLRRIAAEETAMSAAPEAPVAVSAAVADAASDVEPTVGESRPATDLNPRIPLFTADRFAAPESQPSPLLTTYYCE
ncbi:MAG TPA: carbon storage regulator [Pirellulaceae bacterium]|nr:carbon storage regulator [Pirellulaceae bacterium]